MLRYYAPRPAAAAVGAMRRLCTSAPKLTLEQAITSSHLVLDILKSPEVTQHLHSVRSADKLAKWQSANTALIQSTLRVLPQLGYPADVSGLQEYTAAFATHARAESSDARETLQGLNTDKWRVLLEGAFGCEPASPMSKDEARKLAVDMVDALQDEELLKQVESGGSGLLSKLSDQERQHMVARAVVGVQSEVIEKHGYKGDAGFAQAQVALMDHAADAIVTASVAAATTALYARAGINLQQALKGL